jgi:hypothetical protein
MNIIKPYIISISIAVSAALFSPPAGADNPLVPSKITFITLYYQEPAVSMLKSDEKVDAITQASRMTRGKEIGCMGWGFMMGAIGGGLLGGIISGIASGGRSFKEVVDRSAAGLLFGAVTGGTLGMTYSVYWLNKFENIHQMPEEKRPLKVFLCHARSDAKAVRALYNRLTADGVDAWLDKEKLLPGQDFDRLNLPDWELEIRKVVCEVILLRAL